MYIYLDEAFGKSVVFHLATKFFSNVRERLSLLTTGNGSVLVGWFYKENKVLLRTDIFIVKFN